MSENIDLSFINHVERNHFRTNEDTGANLNALLIWNMVRRHVGLDDLTLKELPAHCKTHNTYHVIRDGYGCERTPRD